MAETIAKELIQGLRDVFKEAGFFKAVIGLSGGVDSAVAASLCAHALGKENVFAYFLPYKTSNPQNRKDSFLMAESLGINIEEKDISNAADALAALCDINSAHRLGNVCARLRMTVLFDMSSKHNALVVGTGNRSEILLGYMTWFGDSACSVNPLGSLYKTQVWQLAKELAVPERIINKAPSADLMEGQTDEGDFGFTYKEVDKLFAYLDKGNSVEDALSYGFDKNLVEKTMNMVTANRFKSSLPKILKLSGGNVR